MPTATPIPMPIASSSMAVTIGAPPLSAAPRQHNADEERDDRGSHSVVQAALHVDLTPDPIGHLGIPEHGEAEREVGRSQDGEERAQVARPESGQQKPRKRDRRR